MAVDSTQIPAKRLRFRSYNPRDESLMKSTLTIPDKDTCRTEGEKGRGEERRRWRGKVSSRCFFD